MSAGGREWSVTGAGYSPEGRLDPAPESPALRECLVAGVLCNDSRLTGPDSARAVVGDPTEAALLVVAEKAGLDLAALRAELPRLDAVPFDSGRRYMATLHERWMGEKGPTDVLAFPMDELDTARPDDPDPGPALLGDVVLCPVVAVRQARAAGHSMADELLLLATHGVLHLLGYDHMEPDEEKEMFGLQSKLLEGWRATPREPVTGEPTEPGTR